MDKILSVNSLNVYVKSILESDKNLTDVAVEGEISDFVKHSSGHFYFNLKDEKAIISAVMFKFENKKLTFLPKNGMKVILRGKVSLYEATGKYQLYVTDMFLSGEGAKHIALEQLKIKLQKEGLFDEKHKKALPKVPFKIGVATSKTGAAFKDIISVTQRRFPKAQVVLAPCAVQGESAKDSIIKAINHLDSIEDIEVIIITRGGGSQEDLFIFNDEDIARCAFKCKKPTVSAVGHEIDFSILDFVCDVRAATPSAAAEIVFPDINALNMQLLTIEEDIRNTLYTKIEHYKSKLKFILNSQGFYKIQNFKKLNEEKLKYLNNDIKNKFKNNININKKALSFHYDILEKQNPLNILKQGYSLIYKDDEYANINDVNVNDDIKILTSKKDLYCKVVDIKEVKR